MTIGERIKEIRLLRGIKVPELASRTGLAASTIYDLERGDSDSTTKLHRIADELGTYTAYLEEGKPPKLRTDDHEPGPRLRGLVPVISWVAAGTFESTSDPFQPGDAEDWVGCPVSHSPSTYVLRVKGKSMDNGQVDGYPDGVLIYVDPMLDAMPGDDVIARLIDRDETTFKRYEVDGRSHYLRPLNPNWPEQIIPITDKTIFKGVVIFSGRKRR